MLHCANAPRPVVTAVSGQTVTRAPPDTVYQPRRRAVRAALTRTGRRGRSGTGPAGGVYCRVPRDGPCRDQTRRRASAPRRAALIDFITRVPPSEALL